MVHTRRKKGNASAAPSIPSDSDEEQDAEDRVYTISVTWVSPSSAKKSTSITKKITGCRFPVSTDPGELQTDFLTCILQRFNKLGEFIQFIADGDDSPRSGLPFEYGVTKATLGNLTRCSEWDEFETFLTDVAHYKKQEISIVVNEAWLSEWAVRADDEEDGDGDEDDDDDGDNGAGQGGKKRRGGSAFRDGKKAKMNKVNGRALERGNLHARLLALYGESGYTDPNDPQGLPLAVTHAVASEWVTAMLIPGSNVTLEAPPQALLLNKKASSVRRVGTGVPAGPSTININNDFKGLAELLTAAHGRSPDLGDAAKRDVQYEWTDENKDLFRLEMILEFDVSFVDLVQQEKLSASLLRTLSRNEVLDLAQRRGVKVPLGDVIRLLQKASKPKE